ncbi:MAG: GIY-YIG nuclease family protein [Candidatus Kariarchaeaceae archaeon]|jgi:putative endonuclease
MFYVYMLQLSDGSLYTGYTKDLDVRLEQHTIGQGSKYVRSRLPFKLVYKEEFDSRSLAMRREIQIKKMRRDKKITLIQKK